MVSFDEAQAQASEILSQKSKGPNGIIAYTVVNDTKTRDDGVTIPYYNPDSSNALKLAYAFFETDRVGVPVVSAPGGTQDVIASKAGQEIRIELTKEDSLKKALAMVGEADPGIKDVDALEQHTLAKLIEKGWDVAIEPQFVAAVREASEEQGIDLGKPASYIGAPLQYERMAMTKRTLQGLEKQHGPLFNLSAASDLGDVHALIQGVEERAGGKTANLRTPQMLFAVQVPGFETVKPVDSGEKIEKKIKGREGSKYRERGVFVTLEDMETQLQNAIPAAREEESRGNSFARQDIVATYERLQIFKKIEAGLVKKLKAQGIPVTSNVLERLADTPDRELAEFTGQATPSELPSVREVPRMAGEIKRG